MRAPSCSSVCGCDSRAHSGQQYVSLREPLRHIALRAQKRALRQLLGVERTVIERGELEEDDEAVIVVHVRPWWRQPAPAGFAAAGHERGEGRRRWRALDLGVTKAFIEADAPRVRCPEHQVVVAAVPWVRHGSRFTRWCEDMTAWLARHTYKHAVTQAAADSLAHCRRARAQSVVDDPAGVRRCRGVDRRRGALAVHELLAGAGSRAPGSRCGTPTGSPTGSRPSLPGSPQ